MRKEGLGAFAVPFDVTDLSAVHAGVDRILREVGPIDILVNNAGGHSFGQWPFAEMPTEVWDRWIDVTFKGVLNCTHAVIKGMGGRGWGREIPISSTAGQVGTAIQTSVYGAAKAGAAHFMRYLSQEVTRQGVTANVIALGYMSTVNEEYEKTVIPRFRPAAAALARMWAPPSSISRRSRPPGSPARPSWWTPARPRSSAGAAAGTRTAAQTIAQKGRVLLAVPVFEVSIMHRWRTVALTLGVSAVAAFLAGILFIYAGIYNVAALAQHGPVANWLFHTVALQSIGRRAEDIAVPKLDDPVRAARGLVLYRRNCLQCHGAPGEAPASFAMGLMPGAPPLAQVGREWPPKETYWVVRNGIKMTAMPAWRYRMTDRELWDVVAFVETLPRLTPADYRAQVAAQGTKGPSTGGDDTGYAAVAGNAAHGKVALEQYACASCHVIPGVIAPPGRVGPTLAAMGDRSIVAGLLANTPEEMVAWIRRPQKVSPGTAMPDMGVSEQDARDMAAYLETLR